MKPQEPIPHNYKISTLNMIFAVSSLALLGLTGALVMADYLRGWKSFQVQFMRLQRERIEQQLEAERQKLDEQELKQLDSQIKAQEAVIAQHRVRLRDAKRDLDYIQGRHYAADQDYRFAKAVADAMRYEAEVAVLKKTRDWEAVNKSYDDQLARVEELKIKLEEVTRQRDQAAARVDVWFKRIAEAEGKKSEILGSIELLNKQLKLVKETTPEFLILNAPMLDFINPTLKVDQIIVRDMFVDLNYLSMPRVDRCTTCHRAIDRPGFESKKEAARLQAELEAKLDRFQIPADKVADVRLRIEQLKQLQTQKPIPNPFRTHPKLDTYVGSASPHPMQDFGCTSCHRGLDRATNFARAGHMPTSGKQQHEWEKEWGWHPQHYLETPMHPRTYLEASCVKCHAGQVTINQGEKITRGTAMLELYGCHACHKINTWRYENLRKPGPDLNGIAEKTNPQWLIRWISEPHSFRSTTRMPAFFYQRNMIGPEIDEKEKAQNIRFQDAELHSIVSFLWAKSTRRPWQAGPAGDPTRGKQLVESVGCMACHIAQETVTDPKTNQVRPARRDDFPLERNYGFNLVGTGTKTHPAWLFNWLKNPKRYYATAPMPDLRLSDQEAADITAYLMTLQKPDFLKKPVRGVDPKAVRELIKSYLVVSMTDLDANNKIDAMSLNEQLVFLGERSIEKYGCFSCHDIKGFEKAKPIGTELTTEGSKSLHLFDFGFVHEYVAHDGKEEHIIHTVPSWVFNKLRSPRVYDDKREKPYADKLKMPNFYLTRAEARAITAVVIGLTEDRVADSRVAARDPRQRTIEEGRKLVSQHNCRGCHVVNGYGRAIAETVEDPGMLPPDLGPEGARVQSPWLFHFLKDPTVMNMRPWLSIRMPTFHFDDAETNTFVRYFAAEGNGALFDQTREIDPPARNVEIGRTFFEMMRCAQCHPTGPVQVTAGVDAASLAPDLQLARVRLRHEWIPDWIRRPAEMIPDTKMPTNFPRDSETGEFTSPLVLGINTPQFAGYKATLMKHYKTEQELMAALRDVVGVTNYLRDYIWSIGTKEMRTAKPTFVPPPPTPQPIVPEMKSTRLDGQSTAGGSP